MNKVRAELSALTSAELDALLRDAEDQFFPEHRLAQAPPVGAWSVWLVLAGRGWGKTRCGAEWLADQALRHPGSYAVAAPTFSDGRDVCVEGESGLLAVLHRRGNKARWNRSLGELILDNGSRLKVGSADEPNRFRGWNFRAAWCDEIATWRYDVDAWTQLVMATRIGDNPRIVATTTPRGTKLLRDLLGRDDESVYVTRGSTFDNAANLSAVALDELRRRYEGTRLGRQELHAELLEDVEGALWQRSWIDRDRLSYDFNPETVHGFTRVVVAIDPAVTAGEDSDDTGMVVAGIGGNGEGYVLSDLTGRMSPDAWARRAVAAYREWNADRIVAEVNNGGDMVAHTIRTVDPNVPVRSVHATRGKRLRAEPIAALYEQSRIHHVGAFPELEDQLCTWTPEPGTGQKSPDRLDALVWAFTELMVGSQPTGANSYRTTALRGRR